MPDFTFYLRFTCYLFLAVLGLHCCVWAFSGCGEQGSRRYSSLRCTGFSLWWLPLWLPSGSRCKVLSSVAPKLECWLSSCGAWAELLCCTWDLPRSGIEPLSPALAVGVLTTRPPEKPYFFFLFIMCTHTILIGPRKWYYLKLFDYSIIKKNYITKLAPHISFPNTFVYMKVFIIGNWCYHSIKLLKSNF